MSTTTNSFQFRLTNVTGDPVSFRTRQNIKKRIANILYLETLPEDAVKLAYVGSQELLPETNLFIGDRSDELYANTKTNKVIEFSGIASEGAITVDNLNFLITQEFIDAESDKIPLYYKHVLNINTIPESVRIFDKDFNEIGQNKYKLVTVLEYDTLTGLTTGYDEYHVYNSLESSYNHKTSDYELFFIQYTESIAGVETTKTELLNNEIAYPEASLDDYWEITGDLKPWATVYSIDLTTMRVVLPGSEDYAVKYIEANRIGVKEPIDYTNTEPWFLRIINGQIRHGYSSYSLSYSLPEFENQPFSPIEPYKLAIRKTCPKITDRFIKLAHEEIQFGSMFSEMYLVFEKDGVCQYAITNDDDYDGEPYYDFDGNIVYDENDDQVNWSTSLLLGIDQLAGIVQTDFHVLDSYDIYGTYAYKEKYFTLSSLVMNPIFDQEVHQQIRVIYLVPESIINANSGIQAEALRYLKVSPSGIILDTNQDNSGYNGNFKIDTALLTAEGFLLTGFLGLHYSWQANTTVQVASPAVEIELLAGGSIEVVSTSSFPRAGWLRMITTESGAAIPTEQNRYVKYDNKTDTSFILSDDSDEIPSPTAVVADGETIELVNFIDERTTLSNRTSATELTNFGGTGYPSVYSQYFVLAETTINPPHGPSESTVIDIRENGGGIKETLYEEAKLLNPEIQWYNDYGPFDGQIYAGKAVAIIKLPISILEEYPLDVLKNIVEESVPFGVYPLIRFYGYEPRIVSVVPGVTLATITWEKEGPEFVYQIWYATNENGPWVQANTYRLTDGAGATNSFVVTGLTERLPYLIKITMQDKYYMWWYGYTTYDSIEGGLGLDEDAPTAPFGNVSNFQFQIV